MKILLPRFLLLFLVMAGMAGCNTQVSTEPVTRTDTLHRKYRTAKKYATVKEYRTVMLTHKWRMTSRILNGVETMNDFFSNNTYTYRKDGTVIYNSPSERNTVRYWEWADEEATVLLFFYEKGEDNPAPMKVIELSGNTFRYKSKGHHAPENNYDITLVAVK